MLLIVSSSIALSLTSTTPAVSSSPPPDASADDSVQQPDDPDVVPPDYEPGAWPLVASIVPGFLIHGSGVYAAGDTETALELLYLELGGIGAILAGGGAIVATGASRRVVGWATPVAIAGVGLFFQSWFADIYGSVADEGVGETLELLPQAEVRGGYRFIYDPQFDYRNFARVEGDIRVDDWRISPTAWFALDDDNQRIRLIGAWRALGDATTAGHAVESGSFVDLEGGASYHRYGTDGFSTLGFEGFVNGRLDLRDLAAVLSGSFAEMGVGYGAELYDFDVPGHSLGDTTGDLLLFRFGWGMFLGTPGSALGQGELFAYYDHRHDNYAAGLGLKGLGGGPAGHFGLEGHWAIMPDEQGDGWGVGAELIVGSAWITGLDVIYRWGGRAWGVSR